MALLPLGASAEVDGWVLARRADGVEVYTRDVEGSALKEFRASAVVPAPLAAVVGWWRDPTTYTQWINRCVEARRVEVDSGATANYLRFDFPFPASDRDVVIGAKTLQDSPKQAVFEGRNVDGLVPEVSRLVRIPMLSSRWEFHADGDGATRAVYQQRMDAGGRLPAFLMKRATVDNPFRTLLGQLRYAEANPPPCRLRNSGRLGRDHAVAQRVEHVRERVPLELLNQEIGNEEIRLQVDLVDREGVGSVRSPGQQGPGAVVALVVPAHQRPAALEAAVGQVPLDRADLRVQVAEGEGQGDLESTQCRIPLPALLDAALHARHELVEVLAVADRRPDLRRLRADQGGGAHRQVGSPAAARQQDQIALLESLRVAQAEGGRGAGRGCAEQPAGEVRK